MVFVDCHDVLHLIGASRRCPQKTGIVSANRKKSIRGSHLVPTKRKKKTSFTSRNAWCRLTIDVHKAGEKFRSNVAIVRP